MEGIQLNSPQTPDVTTLRPNYLIDEPPEYESPPDYEAPPNYDEAIKMYTTVKRNIESNGKSAVTLFLV